MYKRAERSQQENDGMKQESGNQEENENDDTCIFRVHASRHRRREVRKKTFNFKETDFLICMCA